MHVCTQLNVACHQHGITSPCRCGGFYACDCDGSTVFTSSVTSHMTCQFFLSILLSSQQPFRLPKFQVGTLSRIISQLNRCNPRVAQVQAKSHTLASLSRNSHSLHVQAYLRKLPSCGTSLHHRQATHCSMWRRALSLLTAPAVGTACWQHCQP